MNKVSARQCDVRIDAPGGDARSAETALAGSVYEHPAARHARRAQSAQEFQIAAIHQIPAALHGAADAVAQIFAGVVPVGLDAFRTEQRNRDVAMGCASQRSIERLQDLPEPFRLFVGGWRRRHAGDEIVVPAQGFDARFRFAATQNGIGQEIDGFEKARAGYRELNAVAAAMKQNDVAFRPALSAAIPGMAGAANRRVRYRAWRLPERRACAGRRQFVRAARIYSPIARRCRAASV